jgi:4-amino-4-deoxychorismate lyase
MSNVFLVNSGVLRTADLRYCGVRGVMRDEVLRIAAEQGIAVCEEPLWPRDVERADEIFVTNAVRGIRAVGTLATMQWRVGPITQRLMAAVNH